MDTIVEETKEERSKRLERERAKRYRESKKGQDTAKEYRARNREKLLEGKKKHRRDNHERYILNDKKYYESNKELIAEKRVKYYEQNKHLWDAQAVKKYGISYETYCEMLALQNGVCAICSDPPSGRTKRLSVDHCHNTGIVRGLLCNRCNRSLGLLKDDREVLKKAIKYLDQHDLTPATVSATSQEPLDEKGECLACASNGE